MRLLSKKGLHSNITTEFLGLRARSYTKHRGTCKCQFKLAGEKKKLAGERGHPKDDRKQSPEGSNYTCQVKEGGKIFKLAQCTGNASSFNKPHALLPYTLTQVHTASTSTHLPTGLEGTWGQAILKLENGRADSASKVTSLKPKLLKTKITIPTLMMG